MKYIHRTGADHISSSEPYYLDGMRGSDNVVHEMPEWVYGDPTEPKVFTITLKERWVNGWTMVESSGDSGMDEKYNQDTDYTGGEQRTFDRPFTFTYSRYIEHASLIEFVCNRSGSNVPMYLYVQPNGELIIYCAGDRGTSIYWWQKFSQINTGSFNAVYTVDLSYVEGLDEVLDNVIEIINPGIIIETYVDLPPYGFSGKYPKDYTINSRVVVSNISNKPLSCDLRNYKNEFLELKELNAGEVYETYTDFVTENDTEDVYTMYLYVKGQAFDQNGNKIKVLWNTTKILVDTNTYEPIHIDPQPYYPGPQ